MAKMCGMSWLRTATEATDAESPGGIDFLAHPRGVIQFHGRQVVASRVRKAAKRRVMKICQDISDVQFSAVRSARKIMRRLIWESGEQSAESHKQGEGLSADW